MIFSSTLSCESVIAGAFFSQSDFGVPEKEMTKHACQNMMMPSWKFSHFILIHAELGFAFFKLPRIDGLEALERIQKIDAKLPVVVMTAYGTTETAIEATKYGAFDYVLKPFDIPEMLKVIGQAVAAG